MLIICQEIHKQEDHRLNTMNASLYFKNCEFIYLKSFTIKYTFNRLRALIKFLPPVTLLCCRAISCFTVYKLIILSLRNTGNGVKVAYLCKKVD